MAEKVAMESEFDQSRLNLDTLPADVQLLIFKQLKYKDLVRVSQVNKQLYKVANDNLLWKMKLESDIYKWKIISSNNFPIELFSENHEVLNNDICYKRLYLSCCPDVLTELEILRKLKSYKMAEASNNSGRASGESTPTGNESGAPQASALTTAVNMFSQLRDYIYNNIFPINSNARMTPAQAIDTTDGEGVPKIIMFGPGLETTTSCLVTNLLWKSEFKTIGMIPGRDGYGSGIKLKLFNHLPFNLTVLYTNVSQLRHNRDGNFDRNKLFVKRKDAQANENDEELLNYEINPQVKEACSNASGFIYVIDNLALKEVLKSNNQSEIIDSHRQELFTLMRECNKKMLPLLILSCRTENMSSDAAMQTESSLPSARIVQELSLYKLNHEWQIRNCQIFENRMKDIILGFDWILNKIEEISHNTREQN